MKPDKASVDRLLSLDDSTLERTGESIAAAAGRDNNSIRAVTGNLGALREGISKMTESDINAALKMLGKDRISAAADILKDDADG